MSAALQISSAAATAGQTTGLIIDGEHYSFASLQRLVQAKPRRARVLRAQHGLETILQIYASLEERRPLCIVAAQTSDEQIEQITQRLADLPNDIAFVLFTSGSEGQPRGVMLSRQAVLASARASAKHHGWVEHDRWLCPLPLHHVGGLSIIVRCLVDRKSALVSEGFATETVADLIDNEAITHVSLVPTMLWRLLHLGRPAAPGLRLVLVGGAALDEALYQRALAAQYPVVHSYGMTETASQIVVMGRPLEGVELRVQDGHLHVRAPMLMSGYLPPHHRDRPITNGWFATNDRAQLDADGKLTILGRSDDVIISGGENIDPHQVQAALQACDGVQASLALGLPHAEWGQELTALVVGSEQLDLSAIAATLRNTLAGHLRPKRLIQVDELPMLDNGKLDLQKAREIAASGPSKQRS